jgi:hypothetical protein
MDTFDILKDLVSRITCKPGWKFHLTDDDEGFRLVIHVPGHDARDPEYRMAINHFFPVPYTTWNLKSWRRWIFECCQGVENHELGEWFLDGEERPFAPLHGPGENPYVVHEFRDIVDARRRQDGSLG